MSQNTFGGLGRLSTPRPLAAMTGLLLRNEERNICMIITVGAYLLLSALKIFWFIFTKTFIYKNVTFPGIMFNLQQNIKSF